MQIAEIRTELTPLVWVNVSSDSGAHFTLYAYVYTIEFHVYAKHHTDMI